MRNVLLRGAAVAAGVVIVVVLYLLSSSGGAVGDGKQYAERATVDITASWSAPALMDRATSQLEKSTDLGRMGAAFDVMARLGKLLKAGPCAGSATSSLTFGGRKVTASYRCAAEYAAGPATITMDLVRDGDTWRINAFRVDAAALMPLKAPLTAG